MAAPPTGTAPSPPGPSARMPGLVRAAARFDALGLAAVLFLITAAVTGRPGDASGGLDRIDLVAAAIAIALVLMRRRFPRGTLVAGLVAAVIVTAVAGAPTVVLPANVLLLFHLAVTTDRRTAMTAGAATLLVIVTSVVALGGEDPLGGGVLASVGWPLVAVAAGDALRTRRAYLAAVEERARRAEETREEEARRRVAEERLRIARDLHDLVAHHIAVVNVQAGLAGHLLRADPAAAEDALRTVRSSSATVLDELGQMLSVLRDAGDHDQPVAPTPGIDDIPSLVASFQASGLAVTRETTGSSAAVTESVGLAAYRVVQEGLTNAHKHGAGTARVAVTHGPGGVEVTVENPLAETSGNGDAAVAGGFGLIGMRERVAAAGGTLEAGPVGSSADAALFRVRARFATGAAT